jgi:anaerobic selenocysteine-containing dehydrogenase
MAEIRLTHCVMDCPDICALEVGIEAGRVVSIGARTNGRGAGAADTVRGEGGHPERGHPAHPDTGGFICDKVASFDRRLYHAERVLHPLRRVAAKGSGRFERIGWDEAVAEITTRLTEIRDRWGGEAILPYHYGGSNGMLSDELVDHLFFARLGASRLAKTICANPTTEVARGMYGKMPGVAFSDYPKARCIIVWGANPKASNIHLVPYLKAAKRAGAFIATVDPRRNFSSLEVDLHLPVRPGTDLPVALAMIRRWRDAGRLDRSFLDAHAEGAETLLERSGDWTIERAAELAGVAAADIVRLADVYAGATPALIRCGWGLERNRNGGQAVAAILAMPALLGKFGVRGGGYTLSNSGAYALRKRELVDLEGWSTRRLDMTRLGRVLGGDLDPPVKALFVYNANPAATVPDQNAVLRGLAREDLFTVVSDQVLTDTARWADLVLPAATFLESTDLRAGYGSYVLAALRPVVEPGGEAISNMQLFGRLGRAMGFDDEAFGWSDEQILGRAAAAVEVAGEPADAERLVAQGSQLVPFPEGAPNPFASTSPLTPDGKAHLTPAALGPAPYVYLDLPSRYPLSLISPASSRSVTSMMAEYKLPVLRVSIHPEDAAPRGVGSGDRVRVHNDLGEVVCEARVTERVRPGVVSMPKGAWARSSANGRTSTALCPDHLQVVGDGACFNDARVDVEKA